MNKAKKRKLAKKKLSKIRTKRSEKAKITVHEGKKMTKIRRPESLGFRAGMRQRGPRRDGDTEARVRFCRQMLGRQWLPRLSSIIFSDEKLCNAYVGRCWSWCRGGGLAPSRQLDRWAPAVHVWGAVRMNFKLLVFIDEKISSGVYVRRFLR